MLIRFDRDVEATRPQSRSSSSSEDEAMRSIATEVFENGPLASSGNVRVGMDSDGFEGGETGFEIVDRNAALC